MSRSLLKAERQESFVSQPEHFMMLVNEHMGLPVGDPDKAEEFCKLQPANKADHVCQARALLHAGLVIMHPSWHSVLMAF